MQGGNHLQQVGSYEQIQCPLGALPLLPSPPKTPISRKPLAAEPPEVQGPRAGRRGLKGAGGVLQQIGGGFPEVPPFLTPLLYNQLRDHHGEGL